MTKGGWEGWESVCFTKFHLDANASTVLNHACLRRVLYVCSVNVLLSHACEYHMTSFDCIVKAQASCTLLHIAAHVMCVFHSLSSRQTHNLQLPQSKLVLWYGEWQQLQTQHAGMAVYFWNLLALTYSFPSPHWGGIGLGLYITVDHTHFLYCVQERTTCLRATLSLQWLPSCWNSTSRKRGERYVIQWSQTTPTSCLHYHFPAKSDIICRDIIVHNY